MEENFLFGKGSLPHTSDNSGWTESQYHQLKAQIQAYKYLIRNLTLQPEIIEKIRTYDSGEWEKTRIKLFDQVKSFYSFKALQGASTFSSTNVLFRAFYGGDVFAS